MKKIVAGVAVLLFVGSFGVLSASTTWTGTSWITAGVPIPSAQLKSALDYLYESKVDVPQNCEPPTSRIVWEAGAWKCQTNQVIPVVDQPSDCTFNARTVNHGASVAAYQSTSVAYGQSCRQEVRTCTDGVMSGTFEYNTCVEGDPDTCTFNGQAVSHNGSVSAYQAAQVTAPASCVSELRTCNDGSLGGTYTNAGCEVLPAPERPGRPRPECLDEGRVVGTTRMTYQDARKIDDERCSCGGAVTGGPYGNQIICSLGGTPSTWDELLPPNAN